MGVWLTLAELKDTYTSERINEHSGSDDAFAETSIDRAESEARTYLLTRYKDGDLPTTPAATPLVLKRITAKLVLFDLHERQHGLISEDARRFQTDALTELDAVVRGLQSLTLAGPPDVDISSPTVSTRKRSSTEREEVITIELLDEW